MFVGQGFDFNFLNIKNGSSLGRMSMSGDKNQQFHEALLPMQKRMFAIKVLSFFSL